MSVVKVKIDDPTFCITIMTIFIDNNYFYLIHTQYSIQDIYLYT